MNKPLPHLTVRSGPWAGTMVRFATVEQLRAVQRAGRDRSMDSISIIQDALECDPWLTKQLNAPQPRKSNRP